MEKSPSNCDSCQDSSCAAKQAPANETDEQRQDRLRLQRRLCQIERKILVMSGKGGVGKSSTAVNLALSLAAAGQRVGLLDVDVHGPSVPKMLGLDGQRPAMGEEGIVPVAYRGVQVMSLGLLLAQESDAVIWRGAMKHGVIRQLLQDVAWGGLDTLVVDCPPGTGDEPLSVVQLLGAGTGAVVVTTPQEVALQDVRKSLTFCRQLQLPILGLVENMSGLTCPHCRELIELFKTGGGLRLAEEWQIPLLQQIPLEPEMVVSGDQGTPLVVAHPESDTARAFAALASAVTDAGEQLRQPA